MAAEHDPGRVVIVQTVLPDYRTPFLAALRSELGDRVVIVSGDEDWSDVQHAGGVPHERVDNVFLAGRRLLWQSGVPRRTLGAPLVVLELNPRILSTWVALVARRLLRRRTILWGHAWPRRGAANRTNAIRGLMRRLADTLVVYTETEAKELGRSAPKAHVVAAPNSLYAAAELGPLEVAPEVTDFICVGRLTAAKKPALLLDAFIRAAPDIDDDVRLVFVGDGALRAGLEERAAASGLGGRIVFMGHASDLGRLRELYARAIASVSPGYVGLSLIQSLGFGVPMLIARDEPHAPEVEAAVEGENSFMFPSDSVDALAELLVAAARDRAHWLARRSALAEDTRRTYSVDNMVRSFLAALGVDPAPDSAR